MKPYETPEIQEKLNIIKAAVLSVVPDTEVIYLFGSYACGEPHKDSDLDVYVVVPDTDVNTIDTEIAITHQIYSNKFRVPMDLIVKHSSKFSRDKDNATFAKVVARTGVRIYG